MRASSNVSRNGSGEDGSRRRGSERENRMGASCRGCTAKIAHAGHVRVPPVHEDVRRVSNAIGDLMRVAGSDRVHAMRQRGAGIDLSRTEMRFLAVVADQGPMPVTELGR